MILTRQNFETPQCSCGKRHSTTIRKAVIEPGCLARLPEYLIEQDIQGHLTAIYDSNTYYAKGLNRPAADAEIILPAEKLHANEHAVELVEKSLLPHTRVLAAIGSGTVHDIVRYVAAQRNIPFVSCPTAATVDGFASSVAAMTWHGFKKTMPAFAPVLVLADLKVISAAPRCLAAAGVGDMLGKHVCLADWQIGHLLTGEYYCPTIVDMMRKAVKSVEDAAPQLAKGTYAAYESLMYGLILSGIAMQLAGNSRPASGAEHHISHLLELGLLGECDAMHGEKVGVGTLLCADIYHSLAKRKNLQNVNLSAHILDVQELYQVFGSLTDDVMKENEDSCMEGVSAEALQMHWPDICRILEVIPNSEKLKSVLQSCAAKQSMAEIGVDCNMQSQLVQYSPYVRNRLTLMRIKSVYML